MHEAPAPLWLDSRELAARFGRQHHNIMASIDLIVAQCPAAAPHVRFDVYPVTAGLGGTRHVRHALVDRIGFTLLAVTIGTKHRQRVFDMLMAFEKVEGIRPS